MTHRVAAQLLHDDFLPREALREAVLRAAPEASASTGRSASTPLIAPGGEAPAGPQAVGTRAQLGTRCRDRSSVDQRSAEPNSEVSRAVNRPTRDGPESIDALPGGVA
jgi:hypothetical protein